MARINYSNEDSFDTIIPAKPAKKKSELELFKNLAPADIDEGKVKEEDIKEKIVHLKLNELHEFNNHPFNVIDDEEMEELAESIKHYNGVIHPISVRKKDSGYEIISGHRRVFASKKAGMDEIRAIIFDFDNEADAIQAVIDANKQRKVKPSELAKGYKMQVEELKKEHLTSEMNQRLGTSKTKVYQYIKLLELDKYLLSLIDSEKLPMRAGLILTDLDKDSMTNLSELMEENPDKYSISLKTADELTKMAINKNLDSVTIDEILSGKKPNKMSAEKKVSEKKLIKYLPEEVQKAPMEERLAYYINAIKAYKC